MFKIGIFIDEELRSSEAMVVMGYTLAKYA